MLEMTASSAFHQNCQKKNKVYKNLEHKGLMKKKNFSWKVADDDDDRAVLASPTHSFRKLKTACKGLM